MKIKHSYALLTAAACAVLFTGCGDSSSAGGAADAGTRVTRETVTSRETTTTTSMTTENTTATSPPEATSDRTTERKPLSTSAGTATTDAPGLIDRAESALDSIGEAITSVLTEATRPVH